MKKFWLIFSVFALTASVVCAQTAETATNAPKKHLPGFDFIEIKELPQEKDDLYDGADIKPLSGTLSETEKTQEENLNFEYDDKEKLPELLCTDEKLRSQIGAFIYKYVQTQKAKTIPERRAQLLLINNLHQFEEITENELKNNFDASAAAMQLKMNEGREIYRMCVSKNNKSKRFDNVYVLIYPYITYYKVVITNLAETPENLEDATFIYNW